MNTYTFSKRSVFEKIRFGVSTCIVRQSGDPVHTGVDWSEETCLHLKITASVYGLTSSSKSHSFCLFPLLASVILLYCFTCLCPVEGVYVVCESWRQVIKERLQRQNLWNTNKRRSKMKQNQTPHLRLRRRRGRVASEDNSNHPPFSYRRQLPSKQKEMSCYRFRQRDCIAWARQFWSPWKQWQKRSGYHVHTQKRSGSETSVFERSTFGSVFEKLRFWARAFSKSSGYVRIRVTVSMYLGSKSSVFEKTRVRVHVA